MCIPSKTKVYPEVCKKKKTKSVSKSTGGRLLNVRRDTHTDQECINEEQGPLLNQTMTHPNYDEADNKGAEII